MMRQPTGQPTRQLQAVVKASNWVLKQAADTAVNQAASLAANEVANQGGSDATKEVAVEAFAKGGSYNGSPLRAREHACHAECGIWQGQRSREHFGVVDR